MAYREVTMLDVKEVLRLWMEGVPRKRIAAQLGLDPKTVRRYVRTATRAGLRPPDAHGRRRRFRAWIFTRTGYFIRARRNRRRMSRGRPRACRVHGELEAAQTPRMLERLVVRLRATGRAVHARIRRWTRPSTRPVRGFVLDHFRSPAELVRENALLRKQLEIACRHIARPKLTGTDRAILILLARLTPTWRAAVLLVRPETILRWHRQGFKLLWQRRSRRAKRAGGQPR